MRPLQFYPALLLACSISLPCRSQAPADLHRYDERIIHYGEMGKRDSFLLFTERKSELCRRADSLSAWAWARWTASDVLSENLHDIDAAREYLENTWSSRWRAPRDAVESEPFCYIQSNRGLYLLQAGKTLQAVEALEDGAAIYEQYRYQDCDAVEFFYKSLGNCYTRLGDNDKAIAVFFKALMAGGDDETMAGLYCNIGLAYWNKGDYEAAEKYQRQGLSMKDVSGLKRGLLLGALAQTLIDKGQARQAAATATKSLQFFATETPSGEALEYRCFSRRTAGMVYLRLGRVDEAGQLLAAARADALACADLPPRDLGKIDILLSQIAALRGEPLKALVAANQALKDVLPRFRASRPEDNPSPDQFYEENVIFYALTAKAAAARLCYEKEGGMERLQLAMDCHDLAWRAEGRLRAVFQYSSSKLELQGNARAREEEAMHVLRLLYEKTGDARYIEKAFAVAERSKAALLSDALNENLVRRRLADSDARFETLNELRRNQSMIEKQLLLDPNNADVALRADADRLQYRISALETELKRAYPALMEQNPATAADWQEMLPPGRAALVYFCGAGALECFIFQPGKAPVWQSSADAQALEQQSRAFLRYFESRNAILDDPAGYLAAAWALGRRLIPSDVADAQSLIVVPDGYLNFLPFDALLIAPPSANSSLRRAEYLLRRYTLQYAWSLSILRQQNKLKGAGDRYALALAPGFAAGERGLAPLPATRDEQPAHARFLEGAQADLQHFMDLSGQYRVLHLATHAFATAQEGQPPRLELYDQALYLPNIYALPLRADLVTLSACQTGLGHQEAGEGVMSLARAFAQAGAACVVSSLWSVNDRSTGRLLSGFYRNLESGRSIADALHAAKLAYLDDPEMRGAVQSPYFWAGLTMVGDDRVVEEGGGGQLWMGAGLMLLLGLACWVIWRRKRSNG